MEFDSKFKVGCLDVIMIDGISSIEVAKMIFIYYYWFGVDFILQIIYIHLIRSSLVELIFLVIYNIRV